MSRISRHEAYLQIAEVISKRSTCARGANGCVIIGNNIAILSAGYNGPSSGEQHCNEKVCNWVDIRRSTCNRSLHAEENALKKMGNMWPPSISIDIYVTSTPCLECTKMILERMKLGMRLINIFYRNLYHSCVHLRMFEDQGVNLFKVTPLYFVDHFTGSVTRQSDG